jgi:hypothetical protein
MRLLELVTDVGALVARWSDDVMHRTGPVLDGEVDFTTCPASCPAALLLLEGPEDARLEATGETGFP